MDYYGQGNAAVEASQDMISDLPPSNNELDNTSYIDRTTRHLYQDAPGKHHMLGQPSISAFSSISGMTGMTGFPAASQANHVAVDSRTFEQNLAKFNRS